MGKRTVVLIVAFVLASVSAYAIYSFLSNVEEDAQAEQQRVSIFRAAQLLPEGLAGEDALAPNIIVDSETLSEFLPPNAISDRGSLQATLVGRVAAGPISEGQIITTDLWVDPIEQVDRLSTLISEGKQAISVRPDEVRSVAGFVLPGDHINVVATVTLDVNDIVEFLANPLGREVLGVTEIFEPLEKLAEVLQAEQDGGGGSPPEVGEGTVPPEQAETTGLLEDLVRALPKTIDITKIVLQNVEVVAVGDQARVLQDDGSIIIETIGTADLNVEENVPEQLGNQIMTLEVTAEEAEKVAFVFEKTSVWLTLVPPDYVPVETDGITLDDVIDVFERIIATFDSGS